MELLVFGERGVPVLVFPTSKGRFYEWEDFGCVEHLRPRIEAGWLQLWCVDSVDGESFYNKAVGPSERAARHVAYERYLVDEVLPALRAANDVPYLILLGASFGAFHAALFATRQPGVAKKAVCLSGAYDPSGWIGGPDAYFLNPLAFLPELRDEHYLGPLRETEVVIVTGEDDPHVEQSRHLAGILQDKGVPASLHIWDGWAHDWPYWKDMLDMYL